MKVEALYLHNMDMLFCLIFLSTNLENMIWMEKRVDAEIEGKTPVSVSREQFKHSAMVYIRSVSSVLGEHFKK